MKKYQPPGKHTRGKLSTCGFQTDCPLAGPHSFWVALPVGSPRNGKEGPEANRSRPAAKQNPFATPDGKQEGKPDFPGRLSPRGGTRSSNGDFSVCLLDNYIKGKRLPLQPWPRKKRLTKRATCPKDDPEGQLPPHPAYPPGALPMGPS